MVAQKEWNKWFFDKLDAGEILGERDDSPERTNTIDDDDKVSSKLKAMADAMIIAVPSLNREHAVHFLLHTAQGRKLAEHLNSISKQSIYEHKEQPMPQVDVFKLHNIASVVEIAKGASNALSEADFSQILMGHAKLNKRDGETDAAAFSRILEGNMELRRAYGVIKGYATTTPTSTGVGSTETSDDSAEAVRLLQEMAEKQHRTFEQVFADPANKALAARTYRAEQRPTASSPSYAEMQR